MRTKFNGLRNTGEDIQMGKGMPRHNSRPSHGNTIVYDGGFLGISRQKRLKFNGNDPDAGEYKWDCPTELGTGFFRKNILRPGFEIWFSACKFHQKTVFTSCDAPPGLHFNFVLSGGYQSVSTRGKTAMDSMGEHQHIMKCPSDRAHEILPAVPFSDVCIVMHPDLFAAYFENGGTFLDSDLQWINDRPHHPRSGHITGEMRGILQRLIHCNVKSGLRNLFLESQALYLLFCQLAQWFPDRTDNGTPVCHPQDLEAVERVRIFLENNLDTGQDLSRLARFAGMSHTKLNRCFKAVYGCTVFRFLRETRLTRARHLLAKGYTVTEVAYRLGYSSLSHFSQAFYHHFGIYPGQLRKDRHKLTRR